MAELPFVNEADFQSQVLDNATPSIVQFTADWCPPCKRLKPIMAEIAAERGEALNICALNIDDNQGVAARYGVTSVPTVIFFKGGEEKTRMVGLRPKQAIEAEIEQHLAG